jgi:short-subunit dehydrogenase
MSTETALITGASSGIGLHLAREFAKHHHPLVITAPIAPELNHLAKQLRTEFGVEVRTIAQDLEQPEAAQQLFDQLSRDNVQIDILVNDAGHGQKGKFWEIPIERDLSILRLNVEAVLRLTKLFLPAMVSRRSGRILNVASVAGFEPGPLLAVYHASKAFVLSLSEALAGELQDTGVTLTTLCPGPTDTDFFPKADMTATRAFQKAKVMAPQEVAEAGYAALMNGERLVVPGAANKALVFSRRFMPQTAQAKMHEHLYEEVEPDQIKRSRGDMEREAELERTR